MPQINTKLTRLLGIKTPIVSANMAGASGGALAANVSAAGGFGFLAIGYEPPEKFKQELALARSVLQLEHPAPLPIGVGALGWLLEKPESHIAGLLQIALEERVQAIWLSFGEQLPKWIKLVRDYDQKAAKKDKTVIFVVVGSVEQALVAVNDWKVDVVVAQGIEAGGHGLAAAPPLSALVPSILSVLPMERPPILGAGGISTGEQVASVLSLGADGAVVGTRFLASPESLYSDAQKRALVAAKSTSTVRSTAFDRARGTLGWPEGVDGRALTNQMFVDAEAGDSDEEMIKKANASAKAGDTSHMLVWSGSSVGLVGSLQPAQDIVKELNEAAIARLRLASSLVQDN